MKVKFPYSILIAGFGALFGILGSVSSGFMYGKSGDSGQQGQDLNVFPSAPLAIQFCRKYDVFDAINRFLYQLTYTFERKTFLIQCILTNPFFLYRRLLNVQCFSYLNQFFLYNVY